MTTTDKMIDLFQDYRDSFGDSDDSDLEAQIDFANKFAGLVCEYRGHKFGQDQCGKPEHDFCMVCRVLASEAGFRRDHNGWYIKTGEPK